MKTKHTPGNWIIEKGSDRGGTLHIKAITMYGSRDDFKMPLATMSGNNSEANAALIAAAPGMLAALKCLRKEISKTVDLSVDWDDATAISTIVTHESLRAMLRAIAKAEGRL